MTVWPDDVDLACPIDFSGGEDPGANAAGRSVEAHRCNFRYGTPARPAIGGGEGHHVPITAREALDRHNHGPARLHEGLAADAMSMVSCWQRCTPGLSAITRGTHLDQIGFCIVVELGVAVAVERAAGRIIAHGPVLVVKMPIG